MIEGIEYIDWVAYPHWTSKITLGSTGEYYQFSSNWNSRDQSWSISIATLDGEVIIQNRKMVLEVNLLERCYSYNRPDCILVPLTNNLLIDRIDRDSLNNGDVKLYYIPLESPWLYANNSASTTNNNVEYITLQNNLYSNTESMDFSIGGLERGTSFQDVEYSALFDNLLYQNYLVNFTAFVIENIPNEIEVGDSIQEGSYSANFTINNTGLVKEGTLQLKLNEDNLKKYLPIETPVIFDLPEISSDTPAEYSFYISAFNINGVSFGAFYNLNFMYRIYYGEHTESIEDSNKSNPLSVLREHELKIDLNGAELYFQGHGYKWVCYPVAFGDNYTFLDVANDIAVVMKDVQMITIVNEHGLEIEYLCYRTFYELHQGIVIGIKSREQE